MEIKERARLIEIKDEHLYRSTAFFDAADILERFELEGDKEYVIKKLNELAQKFKKKAHAIHDIVFKNVR